MNKDLEAFREAVMNVFDEICKALKIQEIADWLTSKFFK